MKNIWNLVCYCPKRMRRRVVASFLCSEPSDHALSVCESYMEQHPRYLYFFEQAEYVGKE